MGGKRNASNGISQSWFRHIQEVCIRADVEIIRHVIQGQLYYGGMV